MNETASALVIAALLFVVGVAAGLGLGYVWAQRNSAAAIAQLTSDKNVCVASIADTAAALSALKQKYADLGDRHNAMVQLGNAALAERDKTIVSLKADAAKRQTVIVEKAREPDCAALASMPVCPGVAEQLFPAQAQADGH